MEIIPCSFSLDLTDLLTIQTDAYNKIYIYAHALKNTLTDTHTFKHLNAQKYIHTTLRHTEIDTYYMHRHTHIQKYKLHTDNQKCILSTQTLKNTYYRYTHILKNTYYAHRYSEISTMYTDTNTQKNTGIYTLISI